MGTAEYIFQWSESLEKQDLNVFSGDMDLFPVLLFDLGQHKNR